MHVKGGTPIIITKSKVVKFGLNKSRHAFLLTYACALVPAEISTQTLL